MRISLRRDRRYIAVIFHFFFNLYINCNLFLQDAVQTLINAVQELIQTHEATEHSEKKEKQDC